MKRIDIGGMLRGQEKGDGKEQNLLSFHYFVASQQHAVPPIGEGLGSGPARPALNLTIIRGQKMQKHPAGSG